MAEIIGSAVANEAVSRVSSFLSGDKTGHESVEDKAERLEMAVLKIRSVVAVSEDLHISHVPLLQWKAKLKRIADEGDELLHLHMRKKQTLQHNRASDGTTGTSISQFLIQAVKRFAPFCRRDELMGDNTLQRFERLADGADSFFKLVESGGQPKNSIFLPSLTRSLLAGDSMEFSIQTKSGNDFVMLWPWLNLDTESDIGMEACLVVPREDAVKWQKNFKVCIVFHLSEATNILAMATALSCLELLPPQFDAARVDTRKLLLLLTETTEERQSSEDSNFPGISKWLRQLIQNNHRNNCESYTDTGDKHTGNGILLPHPVLRLYMCYASPSISKSSSSMKDGGLPLEMMCHVSPYLLPEKYCSQFELAEHDVIRKLLPKVEGGSYDHEAQALNCKRQIWCPQSSLYCSVAPATSQPLTLSQVYLIECSSTPSSSRRKIKKISNHFSVTKD